MVKFIGEYIAKIDNQGRVVFPSPFKNIVAEEGDLRFVLKRDLFFNCLEMYTYQEWIRLSEEVKAKLNFFNREHSLFWREYMRDRALVEPDPKLGRIAIPKRLLEEIGAVKEIRFVGSDHKIEVWATRQFDQERLSSVQYLELAKKLLG
ncbi:MAG: protein mraZ [Bacteroidales bacterium]